MAHRLGRRRNMWIGALLTILVSMDVFAASLSKDPDAPGSIVKGVFSALMAEHNVPGVAVALSIDGEDYFYEYGVADQRTNEPITRKTLFEIGSVSKLFVAAAATYAEEQGMLSLDDPVGKHVPELHGTPFGAVPLLHLATHTAGGFPLQVPGDIDTEAALLEYLKAWQPQHPLGTHRSYANPSIGFLGRVIARASGQDFVALMETGLFADLKLNQTFIRVPQRMMPAYAWGHDREGVPVRVSNRILGNEAFGVKTSSQDLLRFLKLSLQEDVSALSRALGRTQVGYFDAGPFVQALIWERYVYPFDACDLEAGNSRQMILQSTPVQALVNPEASRRDVALGKTGAMRGFGAYVLLVPEERFVMAILANKNFPGSARVAAAYRTMSDLLGRQVSVCSR